MNRAVAALMGVVFVLASLMGFVHEATTTHVRCAEHGELMHGPSGAAQGTAAAAAGHDYLKQGVDLETLGHEHCDLATAMRESRVTPRTPALVLAPTTVVSVAVAPQAVVTVSASSILRTAPKTSPPA